MKRILHAMTIGKPNPKCAVFLLLWLMAVQIRIAFAATPNLSLESATYFGGVGDDYVPSVTTDRFGNVFLVARSKSPGLATTNAMQPIQLHMEDVSVTKFSGSGERLFTTYFGGESVDQPMAIATDHQGNLIIAGVAGSARFPLVNSVLTPPDGGAFVAKLDASGSRLIYSTFLARNATARAIAVDSRGAVYVTGNIWSNDLPVRNAFQPEYHGAGTGRLMEKDETGDVFLAKLSSEGKLEFATYFGGKESESAVGIALDNSSSRILIGGTTASPDFPVTAPVFQSKLKPGIGPGTDCFVAAFSTDGARLLYSTLVGGTADEYAIGFAVDAQGSACIAGLTGSGDFPLRNPAQRFSGDENIFLTKFNSAGSQLVFSTIVFNGAGPRASQLVLDSSGAHYVVGATRFQNLQTVAAHQPVSGGGTDGYIVKISPTGSRIDYSSFIGGSAIDEARSVAVDREGRVYIAGITLSTNFPTKNPFQSQPQGAAEVFLITLAPQPQSSINPALSIFELSSSPSGSGVKRATPSTATALASFRVNGQWVEYIIDYAGFSSELLGVHLHAPEIASIGSPILAVISPTTFSTNQGRLSGKLFLTQAQIAQLANGYCFLDFHTAQFPEGEIAGRIAYGPSAPGRFSYIPNQVVPAGTSSITVDFQVIMPGHPVSKDWVTALASNTNLFDPDSVIITPTAIDRLGLWLEPKSGVQGKSTVTVTAREPGGESVETTFDVTILPENKNDFDSKQGLFRVISPAAQAVLSGIVELSAEGVLTNLAFTAEERSQLLDNGCSEGNLDTCAVTTFIYVDGAFLTRLGGGQVRAQLDTKRLGNGTHEISFLFLRRPAEKPVCVITRPITVDNSNAVRALHIPWAEVVLRPNETAELPVRWLLADGALGDSILAATYASSDPSVVAVSAAGRIEALSPGATFVTAAVGDRKVQTRVLVQQSLSGFPHFSKGGQILNKFEKGKSLFSRSLLFLTGEEFARNRKLAALLKQAGVTTIEGSLYSNPADLGPEHSSSFETWKAHYDRVWQPTEDAARFYDFNLILTGDDICRTDHEMFNTLNNPFAKTALQYALTKARNTGRVLGIEMVDEVNLSWGDDPKPTDRRWSARNPSIPDDAFVRLMQMLNEVQNRPAISWPVLGHSGTEAVNKWMRDSAFSDFTTQYSTVWEADAYHIRGPGLPQIKYGMADFSHFGRLPFINLDRPIIGLSGITGTAYAKSGPEDHFVVGRDPVWYGETRPKCVMAGIMLNAAAGAAGVRLYFYDHWALKTSRAQDPPGSVFQVGSDPESVGTDRWEAMSKAFNFIGELEPYLLQPRTNALYFNENIVTGARHGSNGTLLMAVNMSESPEAMEADLRPYSPKGDYLRFRLTLNGLVRQEVRDRAKDRLMIESGETIVWLFRTVPVHWTPPRDIVFGTKLSDLQLNASSEVAGSFSYVPELGSVLPVGNKQQLTVTFTPADAEQYAARTETVAINVLPAPAPLVWDKPAPITFGTRLGPDQQNAMSDLPGAFQYNLPQGSLLDAGSNQFLSVIFYPFNSRDYTPATAAVSLDVLQWVPVITWTNPAPILAGVPLTTTQLNAKADLEGFFLYDPPIGTRLAVGRNLELSATFFPLDRKNVAVVTARTSIDVLNPPAHPPSLDSAVILPTNSHFAFQFAAEAGRSYVIESSTNLASWSVEKIVVPASAETVEFSGPITKEHGSKFFRVMVQNP